MIPNTKLRVVNSNSIGESAEFGISSSDSAHIMTILRDTLYSDKVLAVLREYATNAWDAHQEVGKSSIPIKVTLPTELDPTLEIRDFGPGLSLEDVFQVYTQYGASTKRDSDTSVGMLGIGSKSGFAYSDSFTIVSRHGGMKRSYVAVLDKSEKGLINLLHEEPCGDETGVAIQIAVRPDDIEEFATKAKAVYQYFIPPPTINVELPKLPEAQSSLKNGVIYDTGDINYGRSEWVAVMGCVSYRINLAQLRGDNAPEGGISHFISAISGALYFSIGEVQINASREELKYSLETKTALVRRFNALVDEYVHHTLNTIKNGGFTDWGRRIEAQVLNRLNLPVPKDSKDLIATNIKIDAKELPKSFVIIQHKVPSTSLSVDKDSRLILADDRRALVGFRLTPDEYLVRHTEKPDWENIRKDLDAYCEKMGITGIPISKLSELPWTAPTRNSAGKTINPKHRYKVFTLEDSSSYSSPYSDYWEPATEEPTKDDIFVRISSFFALDCDGKFFYLRKEDVLMAECFSVKLPTVYGYKSTDKYPIEDKDCTGIHYSKWREKWLPTLLTNEVKEMFCHSQWASVFQGIDYRGPNKKTYESIVGHLGEKHPISKFVERFLEAKEFFGKRVKLPMALDILRKHFSDLKGKDQAQEELSALADVYPLFSVEHHPITSLWGPHSEKWFHYVKAVDG